LRGNLDLKDWVIEEKLHKNEKKNEKKNTKSSRLKLIATNSYWKEFKAV
jgi:hypothetical protein